jgi:hypothetical protein
MSWIIDNTLLELSVYKSLLKARKQIPMYYDYSTVSKLDSLFDTIN